MITDIGSDADDAMALLLLYALPESAFDLLGVVCCFGEVAIRQRTASSLMKLIAEVSPAAANVPIIAGTVHGPLYGIVTCIRELLRSCDCRRPHATRRLRGLARRVGGQGLHEL